MRSEYKLDITREPAADGLFHSVGPIKEQKMKRGKSHNKPAALTFSVVVNDCVDVSPFRMPLTLVEASTLFKRKERDQAFCATSANYYSTWQTN